MIALAPVARTTPTDARQLWTAALGSVIAVLAVAVVGHGTPAATLLLLGAGGSLLVALTAWRPPIGCAVLALTVPLTAGLGRDTVIPLARTSEVAAALVGIGLVLHFLPRKTLGRFTGMDLAIGGFCGAGVVIPWLVLFVNREPAAIDVWRVVLAPAQYLVLYLIFSRAGLEGRRLRTVINLAMFASVLVALIGLAQLADLPGVRSFVESTFPLDGLPGPICQFGVCRPTSLLEHWSAYGGYALLNYLLALALASWRHPGFSQRWLGVAMAANATAVLASQTQAAIVGMLVGTLLIAWHGRHLARQLGVTLAAIALGVVLFWPQVSARVQQQFFSGSASASSPASLETRYQYWGDYFLPILADHVWTGTGTVIPSDVPQDLTTYVDNEYFRLAFRAGIIGVASLLLMLVTVGIVGWRARASPDLSFAALGAGAVGSVVVVALMGTTAEYLTFAGVSQQFWMVIGLLAGRQLARPPDTTATVMEYPPSGPGRLRGSLVGPLATLVGEAAMVRSSTLVLAGNAGARLLGFLFSIAAARLLLPREYGVFAYALAVANIAAILVTNAPYGLSRWLPLNRGDPVGQNRYFSNVTAVVAAMVALSALLTLPLAWVAGIHGGLLLAVLANILGIAVLQTYLQAQRGQQRFAAMTVPYLLANVIQLMAILGLAAAGRRSPAAFLAAYGLSSVVAVAILYPVLPFGLRFLRREIRVEQARAIVRFVSPLLLHTAFFTVWYGADLVMVNAFVSSSAAGNYAAAKALASVVALAPSAIAAVLLPRIAGVGPGELRQRLMPALTFTALLTAPAVTILIALRDPLIGLLFGSHYAAASQPTGILAIGMALYGFYLVLEALWIGRGRPGIDAMAAGLGMAASLLSGLVLVPRIGLVGAAVAFGLGSLVQLAVLGTVTVGSIGQAPWGPRARVA
jgi:O-antigen/teichoic acid export membrane protein